MKLFSILAIKLAIIVSYVGCVPAAGDPTFLRKDLNHLVVKDINAVTNVDLTAWDSNDVLPTRTSSLLNTDQTKNADNLRPEGRRLTTRKNDKDYKGKPDTGVQGTRRRIVGPVTVKNDSSTVGTNFPPLISKEKSTDRVTVNLLDLEQEIEKPDNSSTSFKAISASSTTTTEEQATTRQPKAKKLSRKRLRTTEKMRKDNHSPMAKSESRLKPKPVRREGSAENITETPNMRGQSTAMMDSEPGIHDIPLSPYTLRARLEEILDLPKYNDVEVKIEILTKTSEYNEVLMLTLTCNSTDKKARLRSRANKYVEDDSKKKYLFIVHGLDVQGIRHIPALSVESKFTILLDYYIKHLDKFNIYLIPMANPDGFQRTLSDGKWAKNVSPQDDCLGVALDRNFEVGWNISRKVNSCSQSFPGVKPFSELEAMAIRDIMHFHSTDIYAYIHVHAASPGPSIFKGDTLLTAPGFTKSLSNDDRYVDLKGDISECLRNASIGKATVSVDTMRKWYGPISGSSVDYAAAVYGIPFGLEMLMQAYYLNDFNLNDNGSVDIQDLALKHVWQKMIDITFNSLHKALKKCQKEKQDDADANLK